MRPEMLINRMKELYVDFYRISVVKSYLSHCQQFVAYHGEESSYQHVKTGVPQGTLLGPILWNIFANSLKPQARYIKYADDTTFYKSVANPQAKSIVPAIENTVMVSQKQNAAELCCMRIASYIYIYLYWFQTMPCIYSNIVVRMHNIEYDCSYWTFSCWLKMARQLTILRGLFW